MKSFSTEIYFAVEHILPIFLIISTNLHNIIRTIIIIIISSPAAAAAAAAASNGHFNPVSSCSNPPPLVVQH